MSKNRGDRAKNAHGTFGLFPGGAQASPRFHSGEYHGVVSSGTINNPFDDDLNPQSIRSYQWYDLSVVFRCMLEF